MDDKKSNDPKIHLIWFSIMLLFIYYHHRDKDASLKQVGEIKKWADILEKDAENLQTATSRLDGQNWQEAVPDVREAAREIGVSTGAICVEIHKLNESLTPAPDDGD